MSVAPEPPQRWHPQIMVGDRLRLVRRDYGLIIGRRLGQKEFAQMLSVPAPTYGSWEAHLARPPRPVLARIAEITDVDLAWLSADTDSPPSPGGTPASTKWAIPEEGNKQPFFLRAA